MVHIRQMFLFLKICKVKVFSVILYTSSSICENCRPHSGLVLCETNKQTIYLQNRRNTMPPLVNSLHLSVY